MLVDAVGRQHQHVAFGDLQRAIIDLDLRIDAERAAQIALGRRHRDAVILGQLLERSAGQPIHARIADVEDVRGGALDHHRAECAHIPLVAVVGVAPAPRLRVEPRIGCGDDAPRRGAHRPGFRGTVIVGEEALDRRLGRDMADLAAADAVGERDRDALRRQQRLVRRQDAVEILVRLFAAFVGKLPDRDFQRARHRPPKDNGASS